jgi:uncharacterized membrane protein
MQTNPTITSLPTYTELLNSSWEAMKNDLALTAGLTVIYFLGLSSMNYVDYLGWLVGLTIGTGYTACLIKLRAGKTFDFKDFLWAFQSFERFLHVVLLSVLQTFLLCAGYLLLIIPGVYLSVALSLANVLFVKENTDSVSALKRSAAMIKGRWWYMAGLLGVLLFLNIVGFLSLLIGLLLTIPLSVHILLTVADVFSKGMASPPPQRVEASFIPVNPN